MGVAKHFRRDHKDYRSWRDVFIKKDAPDFILKPNEANDEIENVEEIPTSEQIDATHETSGNSQLMHETNASQNGLLMMATPGNNISELVNTVTEPIQQLAPPSTVSQNLQKSAIL